MLLQSEDVLPPPGARPDFEAMAEDARKSSVPNEWILVPTDKVKLGMNDPENDEGPDRYFGWDNEKPERYAQVAAFEAKARPITNEEYAQFLHATNQKQLPASWHGHSLSAGKLQPAGEDSSANATGASKFEYFLSGKSVRTVYGAIPLQLALDWPVFASYNELASCAAWMGGRIPTKEEVRSIYSFVDTTNSSMTDSILTKKISAVNGYMITSFA